MLPTAYGRGLIRIFAELLLFGTPPTPETAYGRGLIRIFASVQLY